MATTLQVTADARPEAIRPLRDLAEQLANDTGLSERDAYAVKVCVGEALANAVLHAYPEGEPGPVNVTVDEVEDALEVVVEDEGDAVYEPRDGADDLHLGLTLMTRLATHCTFTAAREGTRVELLFAHPTRERTARHAYRRLSHLP